MKPKEYIPTIEMIEMQLADIIELQKDIIKIMKGEK